MVNSLPMVQGPQETCIQSLVGEDPPEEGKALHSSTVAWRMPRTEEPGGRLVHRVAESDTSEGIERACRRLEDRLIPRGPEKQGDRRELSDDKQKPSNHTRLSLKLLSSVWNFLEG